MTKNEEVLALRRYISGLPVQISDGMRRDFDDFITIVDCFFEMRSAAELRFKTAHNLAKDKDKALPLGWEKVRGVLVGDSNVPPMRMARKIAEKCFNSLNAIYRDPKKVLRRTREQLRLDKVQDVDSACLIHLSRRPGRTLAERSMPSQKILAIARRENFDLLENRVVKTFAQLCQISIRRYIDIFSEKYGKFPEGKKVLESARKFEALCRKILIDANFEHVREIREEIPPPNYVLAQNTNYSQIYRFFVELISQNKLIENLWQNRGETEKLFNRIKDRQEEWVSICEKTCYAHFYSELWLNPQSVKSKELVESPEYDLMPFQYLGCSNSYLTTEEERFSVHDKTLILNVKDLPWSKLVKSRTHPNAKFYLHDKNLLRHEERECAVETIDIVIASGTLNPPRSQYVRDYFEQLKAKIEARWGNIESWVLIVPDNWSAELLEKLISSCPLLRENVTLLWNSVACAHFLLEKEKLQNGDKRIINGMQIDVCKNDNGVLVPWRHRNPTQVATLTPITKQDLLSGAERFVNLRNRGQIPYYDFLEPMYIVVQTEAEEIELRTIIERKEKWPGGKIYRPKDFVHAGRAGVGFTCLNFNLLWAGEDNERRLRDMPLRNLTTEKFEEPLKEDVNILMDACLIPGQGLAQLIASCQTAKYYLNYEKLKEGSDTCNSLEERMSRSFPPKAPFVFSSPALFQAILRDPSKKAILDKILTLKIPRSSDLFAQARYLFSVDGIWPKGISSLERLRRVNVFGNAKNVPKEILNVQGNLKAQIPDDQYDFTTIFQNLSKLYCRRGMRNEEEAKIAHLIAWTYQADNPSFSKVKADVLSRFCAYVRGNGRRLAPQYYTLLANMCNTKPEVTECLNAICHALLNPIDGFNQRDEIRLLYNLLMFNPDAFSWVDWRIEEVTNLWGKLVEKTGTMTRDCAEPLKALLYLLRYRTQNKVFLHEDGGSWQRRMRQYSIGCLNNIKRRYENRTKTFAYADCVLNYLNGNGTIDGIPQG